MDIVKNILGEKKPLSSTLRESMIRRGYKDYLKHKKLKDNDDNLWDFYQKVGDSPRQMDGEGRYIG